MWVYKFSLLYWISVETSHTCSVVTESMKILEFVKFVRWELKPYLWARPYVFCFVFFGGGGVALKFLKKLSTFSVCFFPGLGKRKTNARPGPVFPHVPPLHDNGWMRGGVALELRFVTMYCSWSDGYEVKQEWRQLGTATYKCSKNRHHSYLFV